MSISDYISELDAASLCGVTTITLNRFAEAGYLCMDERPDGTKVFSRSELERVFSLSLEPEASDKEFSNPSISEEDSDRNYQSDIDGAVDDDLIVKDITLKGEEAEKQSTPDSSDREITRLTTVVQLQEKYIELKEQELKNLRDERDWLRSRIEKLEEKADRDQLVLVSISETNRGLIKALEGKKSAIKLALEWVGLLPAPEAPKQ